jgi:hypothetical protein
MALASIMPQKAALWFAQDISGIAHHSQRFESPSRPDIGHLKDVRIL